MLELSDSRVTLTSLSVCLRHVPEDNRTTTQILDQEDNLCNCLIPVVIRLIYRWLKEWSWNTELLTGKAFLTLLTYYHASRTIFSKNQEVLPHQVIQECCLTPLPRCQWQYFLAVTHQSQSEGMNVPRWKSTQWCWDRHPKLGFISCKDRSVKLRKVWRRDISSMVVLLWSGKGFTRLFSWLHKRLRLQISVHSVPTIRTRAVCIGNRGNQLRVCPPTCIRSVGNRELPAITLE